MEKVKKPFLKRLLGSFSFVLVIVGLLIFSLSFVAPVFATNGGCPDGGVPTMVLGNNGCAADDRHGSAILDIITTVIHILTIGAAIFAAAGITIVGIQYLTAGDNEQQVRTAKRRLFEIVVGMIIYVALYALLAWLVPGFSI